MKRRVIFIAFTSVLLCGFLPNASPQAAPSEKERLDRYYSLAKLAYAERERRATLHSDWNDGNAIFHANAILGIVALRRDNNLGRAKDALLTAGRTPGSPQLNSFGPNMTLPQELLARGQRDTALEFIDLSRAFLKSDVQRLDRWAALVRSGGTPVSDPAWQSSLKYGH